MSLPERALLEAGVTCAEVLTAPEAGLLIDGRDYYRAVFDACCQAERSILIAGWQFDTRARLLHPPDDDGRAHPCELLDFLRSLCDARPGLEVHVLAWDAASLFALEREWMQELRFRFRGHPRIHYRLDACHPISGSQHQKVVIVDRALAFLGGMDVCGSRWDDREHRARDERRTTPGRGPYAPYHDVQAYVTGDAVDTLRGWFAERWRRCAGGELTLPALPRTTIAIQPTRRVQAPVLGLCRTVPGLAEPVTQVIEEVRALHVRAIRTARQLVYIENQYFSSEDVRWALLDRMGRTELPRLDVVVVLPARSAGTKEQISIGVRQAEILRELTSRAGALGHRFGVYYTVAPAEGLEVPVFIHSKVLAVDDRFLLVSSANITNRSMGLDTELGLAWEAPAPTAALRAARVELLREHVGLGWREAEDVLGEPGGLVDRLERIADARTARLRRHALDESRQPGHFLAKLLADEVPLDPDRPVFEALFPIPDDPASPLDRLVRGWRQVRAVARQLRRRRRHRTLKSPTARAS